MDIKFCVYSYLLQIQTKCYSSTYSFLIPVSFKGSFIVRDLGQERSLPFLPTAPQEPKTVCVQYPVAQRVFQFLSMTARSLFLFHSQVKTRNPLLSQIRYYQGTPTPIKSLYDFQKVSHWNMKNLKSQIQRLSARSAAFVCRRNLYRDLMLFRDCGRLHLLAQRVRSYEIC